MMRLVHDATTEPRPDILMVLPNLEPGGAERVSVNLANAWTARGLKVEIALLHNAGSFADQLAPGVAVTVFGVHRARQAILPLGRYLSRRRPHATLAVMPPATWITAAARVWARSPTRLVLAEHTDWSAPRLSPPNPNTMGFHAQTQVACRIAAARVAVSEGVADALARIAKIPRREVEVIHNPITPLAPDGEADAGILAAWNAAKGRKLIAVGALKPAKDFATLLHAVARLRKTMPVSLLLLGEGPLRRDLEALRSQLHLEDCVHMPGFAPNPQAYLRRADVLVLSSTNEGFANVLVEALACGLPVVSTDCRSGPREVLDGGRYGDLVAVADPDALAVAIETALDRSHDREALVKRSQGFSIDVAADRYLDLLRPDLAQARVAREQAA
jgi:glycosyltransferase involved in cell wall biosynthesis